MADDVTFKVQFQGDDPTTPGAAQPPPVAQPAPSSVPSPSGPPRERAEAPRGPTSADPLKQVLDVAQELSGYGGFAGLFAAVRRVVDAFNHLADQTPDRSPSHPSAPDGRTSGPKPLGGPEKPSGPIPVGKPVPMGTVPPPAPSGGSYQPIAPVNPVQFVKPQNLPPIPPGVPAVVGARAAAPAVAGAAGGAGGTGGGLAALAAAAAPAAIAVAAIAGAIAAAVFTIKKVVDALDAEVHKIEHLSPDVALAAARADIRQQQNMMNRAERIGPDLAKFQELRSRVDQQMSELWTNILERLLFIVDLITPFIDQILKEIDVLNAFMEAGLVGLETIKDILTLNLADMPKNREDAIKATEKVAKALSNLVTTIEDEHADAILNDPFLAEFFEDIRTRRENPHNPRRRRLPGGAR